jgi:signal transduction histidine kinase
MRERLQMIGGKMVIRSIPKKGTTIEAQVPFSNRVKTRKSRGGVRRGTRAG